ncbi:Hsp20/alpha crystallin family protein [Nostoc sp. NIES-2111]
MPDAARKAPVPAGRTPPVPQEWRPFDDLRREVDRLFETFTGSHWPSLRGFGAELPSMSTASGSWALSPTMDVSDHGDAIEITAELPGLDDKSVKVTLDDGVLTIHGEKQEEKEEKKKGYFVKERRFGSFERSLRLPEGVDASKINATVKNGVLTVTVPKTAAAITQAKAIPVKTG